jgi:F-type H+-transporting ATPase subunit b
VININVTLFIQIINFLVLLFILNAILYKPILAKMREREAKLKQDREKAMALEQKVLDQENLHQEELAKARQVSAQDKFAMIAEAKQQESDFLTKARDEAARIVEGMKAEIEAESKQVRERLRDEMKPLARSIAEKILGRAIP